MINSIQEKIEGTYSRYRSEEKHLFLELNHKTPYINPQIYEN